MGFLTKTSALGLSALLSLSLATSTQAQSINGKRFQDWGANCQQLEQGQHCYLEQVLHDGAQKVMVSVIGYLPGQSLPTLAFELPPNIHLPAGFTLSMGNQTVARFQGKCTPQICNASVSLTPQLVTQFQRGREATLSYQSLPKQKPVNLPLSLMGITAGLNSLKGLR